MSVVDVGMLFFERETEYFGARPFAIVDGLAAVLVEQVYALIDSLPEGFQTVLPGLLPAQLATVQTPHQARPTTHLCVDGGTMDPAPGEHL